MSKGSIGLTDTLQAWVLQHGLRDDELLARLRDETGRLPNAGMQIAAEQGQLLGLLVKLVGARRAVEVGVFTGYSGLCIARALGPHGDLLACDVSAEWTAVARRYWKEAGVDSRIRLELAPARETLEHAVATGWAGTVDFMFIDADKGSYGVYYDLGLELLRPGGLLAVDNMLWGGKVADPAVRDTDTLAIRALAQRMHSDARIEPALLPIGDGVALAMKV